MTSPAASASAHIQIDALAMPKSGGGAGDDASRRARTDAGAQRLTLDPSVAARDPGLVAGVDRTADEVVPGKIGEAHGRAAAR